MELTEEIDDGCGLITSGHYIDFYYETCSETWDADSAATGIEDYTGERGIYYDGTIQTTEDSFHVVRAGYREMFAHDVGVYDIEHTPFDEERDVWPVGTEVQFTACVENYGLNPEYDVRVVCKIADKDAEPDTIVYYNYQTIDTLYCRDNPDGKPYQVSVDFPRWVVPSENWVVVECRTELEGDQCSANDFDNTMNHPGVTEEGVGESYTLSTPEIVRTECPVNFSIADASWVRLEIFDVNGRRVRTLENDAYSPGQYQSIWNLRDGQGRKVSSGVYFVRLEAGEVSADRRVIVVR